MPPPLPEFNFTGSMIHNLNDNNMNSYAQANNRTTAYQPDDLMGHGQQWAQQRPDGISGGNFSGMSQMEHVLCSATHAQLLSAPNPAYNRLYESSIREKFQLEAKLEAASQTILELKHDIKSIRTELDSAHSVASAASAELKLLQDRALPTRSHPDIEETLEMPPTPPTCVREDYEHIKVFWDKDKWAAFCENEKNHGRTPNVNGFLINEDGHPPSMKKLKAITKTSRTGCNTLYHFRYDPTTWSKKNTVATKYITNHMTNAHPEFGLCNGNWKIEAYMTEHYPDWTRRRDQVPNGLTRAKPSVRSTTHHNPKLKEIKAPKAPKRPLPIVQSEDMRPKKKARAVTPTKDTDIIAVDDDDDDDIYVKSPAVTKQAAVIPTTSMTTLTTSMTTATTTATTSATTSITSLAPTRSFAATATTTSNSPLPPSSTLPSSPRLLPTVTSSLTTPLISSITPPSSRQPLSSSPLPSRPTQEMAQPAGTQAPQDSENTVNGGLSIAPSSPPPPLQPPPENNPPLTPTSRQGRIGARRNPLADISIPRSTIAVPRQEVSSVPKKNPKTKNTKVAKAKKPGKIAEPTPGLLSARNLFLIDYYNDGNEPLTTAEFREMFNALDNKKKQDYEQLSKQRKATRAPEP